MASQTEHEESTHSPSRDESPQVPKLSATVYESRSLQELGLVGNGGRIVDKNDGGDSNEQEGDESHLLADTITFERLRPWIIPGGYSGFAFSLDGSIPDRLSYGKRISSIDSLDPNPSQRAEDSLAIASSSDVSNEADDGLGRLLPKSPSQFLSSVGFWPVRSEADDSIAGLRFYSDTGRYEYEYEASDFEIAALVNYSSHGQDQSEDATRVHGRNGEHNSNHLQSMEAIKSKHGTISKLAGSILSAVAAYTAEFCRQRTTATTDATQSAPSNSNGTHTQTSQNRPQKRKSGSGGGGGKSDDGDNDDNADKRRRMKIPGSRHEPGRRLACPFFKHDAQKYKHKQSCTGPGFASAARVKEHIYRQHRCPIYCPRCYGIFSSDEILEEHFQNELPCSRQEAKQPDGVNQAQQAQLKSRRMDSKSSGSEASKWRHIYKIIFSHVNDEDISSPYYEYHESTKPSQEDSRSELQRYGNFLQGPLPQEIQKDLEDELKDLQRNSGADVRSEFPRLFRDYQLRLLRYYMTNRERDGVQARDCSELVTEEAVPEVNALPGGKHEAEDDESHGVLQILPQDGTEREAEDDEFNNLLQILPQGFPGHEAEYRNFNNFLHMLPHNINNFDFGFDLAAEIELEPPQDFATLLGDGCDELVDSGYNSTQAEDSNHNQQLPAFHTQPRL